MGVVSQWAYLLLGHVCPINQKQIEILPVKITESTTNLNFKVANVLILNFAYNLHRQNFMSLLPSFYDKFLSFLVQIFT